MMIAQDDENLDGEELKNQNFKIIPFNASAESAQIKIKSKECL